MQKLIEGILEETLPVLKKAKRYDLLSDAEVRVVIKRRRDLEHAIARPTSARKDFLHYAVFEKDFVDLLEARLKRHHANISALQKQKKTPKVRNQLRKLRYYAHQATTVVRESRFRINAVYSRALKRFPRDASLWIHYAKYCIDLKHLRLTTKILMNAISLAGYASPEIWLFTISFHFDYLGDSRSARAIAQKALRAFPEHLPLWLHYFQLECYYLSKLVARRYSVGLSLPTDEETNQSEQSTDHGKDETNADEESKDEAPSFWVGAVPLTVFKTACEKITLSDIQCLQFYAVLVNCPFTPPALLRAVYAHMSELTPRSTIVLLLAHIVPWECHRLDLDKQIALSTGRHTEKDEKTQVQLSRQIDQLERNGKDELSRVLIKLNDTASDHFNLKSFEEQQRQARRLSRGGEQDKPGESPLQGIVDSIHNNMLKLRKQSKTNAFDEPDDEVFEQIKYKLVEQLRTATHLDTNSLRNPSNWDIQTLSKYLRQDCDTSIPVSGDDLFTCVSSLCLVPFRSDPQDAALCAYLAASDDISDSSMARLSKIHAFVVSQPPATMRSLVAVASRIIRLLDTGFTPADKTLWCDRAEKALAKAANLKHANEDVSFWTTYVDFERRIVRDAKKANAAHTKALKVLNSDLHTDFIEQLSLLNLR